MRKDAAKTGLMILFGLLCCWGCTAQSSLSQDEPVQENAGFSSSAPSVHQEQQPERSTLRLAYDANDTLNPYTASSLRNRQLLPLLYDGLVETDESFAPKMRLARSVTVEDMVCTVTLRQDVTFHNGDPVTGRDVLYSLTTAQSSQTDWAVQLQNLAGASVSEDGRQVMLQLHRPQADFATMLTCPIVQEGTAEDDFPVAAGKYYVSGAHHTGLYLRFNPLYDQEPGNVTDITLIHAANAEALQFRLRAGEIDMGYSGTVDSVVSGLSVGQRSINTSNMVYLGANGNHSLLASSSFRRALSLLISRDAMVKEAFGGKGDAAMYPFHPRYYKFGDDSPRQQPNISEATDILEELGLSLERDELWYENGEPVKLRLLVNTENAARLTVANLIAGQLQQEGITVELITTSFSQYTNRLSAGDFDLYLGEVKLTEDFQITPLLSGGELAYFAPYGGQIAETYERYRGTGEGFLTFCDDFAQQYPFIPLLFPRHDVYMNHETNISGVSTQQNIFYDILSW